MTISTKMVQYGLLLVALVNYVQAECPNACSGHGDCGNFDQCNCWRNWMANDCSERICPFALAHIDLPKGDLNHDNTISQATEVSNLWTNVDTAKYHPLYYTTGSAEKFPHMDFATTAQIGNVGRWDDAGHYYAECANKGLCDRSSGECECFEGYEGTACQRASCPNKCSGHGTCESIRELAEKDHSNIYELWDRDATYGCDCDAGYYGADCSLRYCKMGVDPLYYDDEATIRTNSWYIHIDATDGTTAGTFGLKFYDVFDEDYVTAPVVASGEIGANDKTGLKNALLGLPNSVIEEMTFAHFGDANDAFYAITFTDNPGKARTPEIDLYLNGNHGANSKTTSGTGVFSITTGGLSGEFKDYFYSKCEGVTATVTDYVAGTVAGNHQIGAAAFLTVDDTASDGGSQFTKLKKCLGDSNGETSDNIEIYNWDTGAISFKYWDVAVTGGSGGIETGYGVGQYPHAIKLVETSPGTEYEGGHFYITYMSSNFAQGEATPSASDEKMMLLSRLYKGDGATSGSTNFYVYTTDAVVKLVYVSATATPYDYPVAGNNDGFGGTGTDGTTSDKNDEFPIYAYWTKDTTTIYTSYDASCEYMNSYADDTAASYGDETTGQKRYVYPCLQKGDYIMLPDGAWGDYGSSAAFKAAASVTAVTESDSHMDSTTKTTKTFTVGASNTNLAGGYAESKLDYSGHIYEIKKIWTAPYGSGTTAAEDRFRITVDKPIPWDGNTKAAAVYTSAPSFPVSDRIGINPIFKFDVATTTDDGNVPTYFEYVSECSNKGICNSDTAICECFKGYTGAACETQSAFAM